jgi:hypothetical protein
MLVPKEHLPRASGMVQSAQACAQLISPLLAGVLLGIVQLILDVCLRMVHKQQSAVHVQRSVLMAKA